AERYTREARCHSLLSNQELFQRQYKHVTSRSGAGAFTVAGTASLSPLSLLFASPAETRWPGLSTTRSRNTTDGARSKGSCTNEEYCQRRISHQNWICRLSYVRRLEAAPGCAGRRRSLLENMHSLTLI
ncbi:unnamed protein product, partial [Hapterophycus canaliculatus]